MSAVEMLRKAREAREAKAAARKAEKENSGADQSLLGSARSVRSAEATSAAGKITEAKTSGIGRVFDTKPNGPDTPQFSTFSKPDTKPDAQPAAADEAPADAVSRSILSPRISARSQVSSPGSQLKADEKKSPSQGDGDDNSTATIPTLNLSANCSGKSQVSSPGSQLRANDKKSPSQDDGDDDATATIPTLTFSPKNSGRSHLSSPGSQLRSIGEEPEVQTVWSESFHGQSDGIPNVASGNVSPGLTTSFCDSNFLQSPASPARSNRSPQFATRDISDQALKDESWQTGLASVEHMQMQIQTNQTNLVHSQIKVLTRELGNLQKRFVSLVSKTELNRTELDDRFDKLRTELDEKMSNEHACRLSEHRAVFAEMEVKLRGDLQLVADDHANNLGSVNDVYAALRQEVADRGDSAVELKLEVQQANDELSKKMEESIANLSKVIEETANASNATAQVDELRQAVDESQKALAKAMEDDLGIHKQKADEMRVALEERFDASAQKVEDRLGNLHKELADHGANAMEMKVAMEQAHQALSQQLEDRFSSFAKEVADQGANAVEWKFAMDEHSQKQNLTIAELEAKLREDLQKLSDDNSRNLASFNEEHRGKHVQNADALETGLKRVLESTHVKLQADLLELRSGVDGSQDTVSEKLATVSQRVDNIKAQLDRMQGAHASMKLNLERCGQTEDVQALQKSTAGLKSELQECHSTLRGEIESHAKSNEDRYAQMQDRLRSFNAEHLEKHTQNAKSLETGLESVLTRIHTNVQEELRLLKSGGASSVEDLSKVLNGVTQQVDRLDQAVQKEHELRMAVEARLDKMLNEQDKTVSDLRKDMLMKEDTKATSGEAHEALKMEYSRIVGRLEDKLDSQAQAHSVSLAQLEIQLRNDMMRNSGEVESYQKDLRAVDERIQLIESSEREQGAFREIQSVYSKIQDLTSQLQGQKSKGDFSHASFDERINSLERQSKDSMDSQNTVFAQLRGEAMAREKHLSAAEGRMSKIETHFLEITDRHASELEGSNTRVRDAVGKLEQQRSAFDTYKGILEKRMSQFEKVQSEAAETHSQSLSSFHNDYGKEISLLLQAERAAREAQERTFLEYIQDARQQKDAMEATVQEQLRLERVAREVQSNQLKDHLSHQMSWHGNSEYTDILLQERQSREAAERSLERRLEAIERGFQVERTEHQQELGRLWDAFDGHTHEASIVNQMSQTPNQPHQQHQHQQHQQHQQQQHQQHQQQYQQHQQAPTRHSPRSQSPPRATRLVHPPQAHVKATPVRLLEGPVSARSSSVTRVSTIPTLDTIVSTISTLDTIAGQMTPHAPVMISGSGSNASVGRMISYPATSSYPTTN